MLSVRPLPTVDWLARVVAAGARSTARHLGQRGRHGRRSVVARAAVVIAGRPQFVDALEPRRLLSAALDLIGVNALRADGRFDSIDGSGMTVAVIDTGVDFSHPLLSTAKVAEQDLVYGGATETLTDEHGTHVAGIIGARDADIGVATGVGLVGLQVFTASRGGDVSANDSDIEDALAWVLANHAQYNIVAVNMSLGSGNYLSGNSSGGSILFDDVKRLEAAGVTVVSAAGNSYADLEAQGSAAPGVFSTLDVGAVYETNEGRVGGTDGTDFTTAADRITYFSQRPAGDNEVFAPGAFIRSTVPGGGTKDLAGTSMASPMVAGVVALMQEAAVTYGGRQLSTTEVRTIIQQTGDVIVDGDDEDTSVETTGDSYLRVNAYHAVEFIYNLFTGGSGTGTGGTGVDPNGTIATAVAGPVLGTEAAAPVAAAVGTDGTTDVGGDDVDLYRLTVNAPGNVTVTVDTTAFQSVVRVFSATGTATQVATAPGNSAVTLTAALAPGTYYVGVSSAPNTTYDPTIAGSGPDGGTGAYTLSFGFDTTDADGVLSGATDINLTAGDVAQALNASVGLDGAKVVGGADVDFFRVTAPDDGTLLVDIDTPNTATYADTYVRVFDASGAPLVFSDDNVAVGVNGQAVEFRSGPTSVVDAAGAFQGHRTDSFIGGTVTKGTVYYVAVGNYDNRAFAANSLAGRVDTGSTGAYSLYVSFRNGDVNGAIPQAVSTTALPLVDNPGIIGSDGTGTGTAAVGDRDVDFIKINSPTAGILKADIDSFANSDGLTDTVDTTARLFDANGKLLAFNQDGPDGKDPLLYYEIDANTDYYLAVSGAGNDTFDPFLLGSGGQGDTGEYQFSASVLPASQAAVLANDSAADGGVQTLTDGSRVTGQIGDDAGFTRGDTDVDLYKFVAPYSGQFTFTAGPDDDFGVDPFLRVFAADGTELAADDNGLGDNTGGSKATVTVVAGQTYLVGVSGAGPSAATYNPITGDGAGSGDTGGYFLLATGGDRALAFDAKSKAVYTDADGSTVTVSLKGPGTGTVRFAAAAAGGNANAASIVLDGATDATTVTVKGNSAVGQVTVNGSLRAFVAKALDLTGTPAGDGAAATGGLAATGGIRSVQLGDVTAATISIGTAGGGSGTTFSAVAVSDSSLTSAGRLASLKVGSWTDADGTPDQITAPAVTVVTAKSDFGADVLADAVGTVKVGGTLRGDVRSTGDIRSVTANGVSGAAVFAGVAAGFVGLPDSADDFANAAAVLSAFAVRGTSAGAFAASYVAAPTVRRASLGSVDTTADGVVFGVAAQDVFSVTGRYDGQAKFSEKGLADVADSLSQGDFLVRVL
jgi:subtilisin family serine protease